MTENERPFRIIEEAGRIARQCSEDTATISTLCRLKFGSVKDKTNLKKLNSPPNHAIARISGGITTAHTTNS